MRKLRQKSELEKSNFRYNILTTCAYFVGIIIIIQLFNLQIVNGAEYRETSNTRLSREGTIEAARGSISDRTGTTLVSTELGSSVEMYKTNVDDDILNNSILLMTNILKQNGDTYINPFPISINPFGFMFDTEEELAEWRKRYGIPEAASAEEAFYIFRDKYNIKNENPEEILQILAIRYAITTEGYSTTKTLKISDSITPESAVQLQEMGQSLTGVSVVQEPVRKYHTGTLASHIIGYVQRMQKKNLDEFEARGDTHEYEVDDKVGQTGIEYVFEEYLRGEDGIKQIDMSVDGTITGEYTSQEAIGGANIVLTIDANLQGITERALATNIEKIRTGGFSQVYDAQGGSAVVMNVNTGEILAMASYPDYNPEYFYNGISKEIYNSYQPNRNLYFRAISSPYAPGSTFKMITAVAALEAGVTDVNELINDSGHYVLNGVVQTKIPACWYFNTYGRGHGYLNVVGALEKSCNYFFFEVANRMGIDVLEKYAKFYGIGSKTGVELSSEKSGIVAGRTALKDLSGENWTPGHTLNASIGQGINNVTPLQMARYISMIANGGKKINTTIVKDVILSNGTYVARSEIEDFVNKKLNISEDVGEDLQISETTTRAVLEGMLSVTDDAGGTAYSTFQDFNIRVGGKTGSAEAENNKVHAWFVGFAPFDEPEIAVVVMVENGGHGSYTAEVVRDIISEYFGMNVQSIKENMTVSSETESFR